MAIMRLAISKQLANHMGDNVMGRESDGRSRGGWAYLARPRYWEETDDQALADLMWAGAIAARAMGVGDTPTPRGGGGEESLGCGLGVYRDGVEVLGGPPPTALTEDKEE